MLKTTCVVSLSLCFLLFSNIIQKIHAQDDGGDDERNEHVDYNDAAAQAAPPAEHHDQPLNDHPPGPPAPDNADPHLPQGAGDEQGPHPYNEYPGPSDGFAETDNGFTDVTRTTDKEERKLTPEMVEKFTAPLLENRWKWDYRREALVKNFWFASFNEDWKTRQTTLVVPLSEDEEKQHVSPLIRRGWIRDKTRDILRKDFAFQSFYGAFSFMTQLAMLSEKIGHFPDWFNVNKKVKITLNSRKIKGLSMKDIVLAKFADKMYNSQKFL